MLRTKDGLNRIAVTRLAASGRHAQGCFDQACEVVVFGSMAVGLERPDSDIDILCIGALDFKLKTSSLDLIAIPLARTKDSPWLESELASHVKEYGTWLKGSPQWGTEVCIGQRAIDEKRRRICAFMKSLRDSWLKLDEVFRVKYSVKLRRETQRLLLLERGAPVPATRILDSSWSSISKFPYEVHDRLSRLASRSSNSVLKDLFGRIDSHFDSHANHGA
jgi:Nucleotidyltransferase domain